MASMSLINQIFNQDCIKGMGFIEDGTIDSVITDPPFAIGFKAKKANYNRDDKFVLEGYGEIKPEDYFNFSFNWMKEAKRTLKDSGSMMIVSGYNNMNEILTAAKMLDLHFVNQIIWKFQFGVHTTKKFVTSHYNIFYFAKDEKKRIHNHLIQDTKLSYKDRESVWNIKREYWKGSRKTPTKLPRALVEKMLNYTTKPADVVLDPFVGSGQVPFIAKEMNRNFYGFELNKDYYDFAKERLDRGKYLI